MKILTMAFLMQLVNAPIPKIPIENPKELPERQYRKADRIIQPYQFGHPASKATCLLLKGLQKLELTKLIEPQRHWDGKRWRTWVDTCKSHTGKYRSITFQGIADAMAEKWG